MDLSLRAEARQRHLEGHASIRDERRSAHDTNDQHFKQTASTKIWLLLFSPTFLSFSEEGERVAQADNLVEQDRRLTGSESIRRREETLTYSGCSVWESI